VKVDNLRRSHLLRAVALALAALGIVVFFAFLSLEQRRRALEAASESLLYDATIASSMVSADLRVAQTAIESALAGRGRYEDSLAAVALQVSDATNAYLLDSDGKVLASAFYRRAPSLSVPGGFSSLLDMRIGIASAEAEGGYVLAIVSVVSPDRRVAVLFRRFIAQGHFTTLLSSKGGLMMIRDAKGSAIRVDGSSFDAPGPIPVGERLEASFAMPSFPLTVSVGMDKGLALAEWQRGFLWVSAFLALAFSLFVALFTYSNRLKSRGLEAERLASELALKELLFKEANHRVKNNLSIVQAILRIAASDAKCGPAEAETLNAAASRVESIALLHDVLSHLRIGESVAIGEYLSRLVEAISASANMGERIRIEIDFQEGLAVDLEVAVPCGLIVNELVTNALKYAFPEGRKGSISVSAHNAPKGGITVGIEDDGVGYENVHETKPGGGLGMQIVALLAEQLGATIERRSPDGGGCAWALAIPQAAARR